MMFFSCRHRITAVGLALVLGYCRASAAVRSGNEYALSLVEAKTPAAQKSCVEEGKGKPFLFRYLEVLACKKGDVGGAQEFALKTREPSSGMVVTFVVRKRVSLSVLQQEPATGVGDAVAVNGVVESVDLAARTLVLNPVIVRYKDRLAPKVGKEMLSERDASSVVYSFTAGGQAVNVSQRDADLLVNEKEMVLKLGKKGWADYLRQEIAKRDKLERDKKSTSRE